MIYLVLSGVGLLFGPMVADGVMFLAAPKSHLILLGVKFKGTENETGVLTQVTAESIRPNGFWKRSCL